MDIVVTTPKSESENAALEADEVKRAGGGFYFRVFNKRPKSLEKGNRVFYVEDGAMRGYAIILHLQDVSQMECDVTGKTYPGRCCAFMDATSWKWIKPIPMKGFQRYKYLNGHETIEVIGNWLDSKPK